MIDNDTILFTTDTLAPVEKVPACLKRLPKPKPVNVKELHADVFEDSTHITSILSGDTLFVERGGAGYGEQGEPVPYNIANDNFIISLLLACFLLALFASAQSHRFIVRQAKNFSRHRDASSATSLRPPTSSTSSSSWPFRPVCSARSSIFSFGMVATRASTSPTNIRR